MPGSILGSEDGHGKQEAHATAGGRWGGVSHCSTGEKVGALIHYRSVEDVRDPSTRSVAQVSAGG